MSTVFTLLKCLQFSAFSQDVPHYTKFNDKKLIHFAYEVFFLSTHKIMLFSKIIHKIKENSKLGIPTLVLLTLHIFFSQESRFMNWVAVLYSKIIFTRQTKNWRHLMDKIKIWDNFSIYA